MYAAVATYCELGCPSCCAWAAPSLTAAVKIGPETFLALTARSPSARIWFGDRVVDDGAETVARPGVGAVAVMAFLVGGFDLGVDVVVSKAGVEATVVPLTSLSASFSCCWSCRNRMSRRQPRTHLRSTRRRGERGAMLGCDSLAPSDPRCRGIAQKPIGSEPMVAAWSQHTNMTPGIYLEGA